MNPMLSLIHTKPDLHTNEEGVNFSRAHPSFVGKVGEGGGGVSFSNHEMNSSQTRIVSSVLRNSKFPLSHIVERVRDKWGYE